MNPANPLTEVMSHARNALIRISGFSFFINILMLTTSVYMLQIYDRVLASRSQETLLYITLFALACLTTMALLEVVRSRILVRLGIQIDGLLGERLFREVVSSGKSGQVFRDLGSVRGFLTGSGILALLDAPWVPLYVGLVYLLHPFLGNLALAGAITLLVIGWANEVATRAPLRRRSR